ncbi:hypothetical protein WDU94_008193, partial [Cyamophila willieti]
KKEICEKPTIRQSKRKSGISQENCEEKSVSDAHEPTKRRQSTRKIGNSRKVCDEKTESSNENDDNSIDDDKPVKRPSLRLRKNLQKSCDTEKPTVRYSLRKLNNTPMKSDKREEHKNEGRKTLKRKTPRNSSKVDNVLTENDGTIEKDAETPSENVVSDNTEVDSSVYNTSSLMVNEAVDIKSSKIKDDSFNVEGEISMETKVEDEIMEKLADSESVTNEDVLQIFKDMEVIKNITIVENLTKSPCKRKVELSSATTPLRKLSESSDDIPLSKLSESSDSDHIVPNGVESHEDSDSHELEEDNSEMERPNIPPEKDPLRIVKVSNDFESHVGDTARLELEDNSEKDESNNQTENEPSNEMVQVEEEKEEYPLEIVKSEVISQQKTSTDRVKEDEMDTRLMHSKINENIFHDKNERNEGSLKISHDVKASHNLCSLDKFNEISKNILPKPVLFVSCATTEDCNVKNELIDNSKGAILSSKIEEPPINDNKLEHPNIKSKPQEEMKTRHIPIHCALDQNRLQPDPTQRSKGIQKLKPNPVKLEATSNSETKKAEVAPHNESIQQLSPTPMNEYANGIIRTRKSRVAHPNKKLQNSSLAEQSTESKKSELISFIASNQKSSLVEKSTNIVKGSLVKSAAKNKTPINTTPKGYNCNLNLVKPNFVDKQTSPDVKGTCGLNMVKENPLHKLSSPVVKNQKPSSAVNNKSNLDGVKANAIDKEPSMVVNSKRIKQILKKMKLLDKFPLIDVIPPTPPLSLSNGTGFRHHNGYNSDESVTCQGKLLESPNKITSVGDLDHSQIPIDHKVEMSEGLNMENERVTGDSSNQNLKLNPKVEMSEKDESVIEEQANEDLLDTFDGINSNANVSDDTKVENVDRNEVLGISSNSSTIIIENSTCRKEENLNSSCGEESEVEHADLVIETDNEEDGGFNIINDFTNTTKPTTNMNNKSTDRSTVNLDSTTNCSKSSHNQFCDGLLEPHNTFDGFLEEPNKTIQSSVLLNPSNFPQSAPTNSPIFPKCIQARLSVIGPKPHLPIYNINVMNIAHNTRNTPKVDKEFIRNNTSNTTTLNSTNKPSELSNNYMLGLPVASQTGFHQGFESPLKATPTINFNEQKSKSHSIIVPENGSNQKEGSTRIYSVNAIHKSPNKDNTHRESITKPVTNNVPTLPTLSFYNSTSSASSLKRKKCEDDICEESNKRQKIDSETVIVNNTENVPDKNTTKDYKLLKRAMEYLQEQIDKDKPTQKNPSTKALEGKLNILFHAVHIKDKVAFDKKIKQIAIEISVNPFEILSRKLISMFDKEQLIDNPKEMSITLTKVFCTILELIRHQPEFLSVFMKTIHETITLHCETTMLSVTYSLVQLYVGLCRWRNDAASVMTFLYDAIYFHRKRAINIMDATITRWPSVYPVGSKCVRVKVMSVILLNQQNHGYGSHDKSVFVKTKQALRQKYRYREQYTYKSVLEDLMIMLRDEQKCFCDARQWDNSNQRYPSRDYDNSFNPNNNWNISFRAYTSSNTSCDQRPGHSSTSSLPSSNCCVQSALILLAKHWTPTELYSVVVDGHLATLFRGSLDSGRLNVAATCAELIGMIGKAMPRGLSLGCSSSILDTLEEGLRHSACQSLSPVRLSIARAISWIASHNTDRVLDILSSVAWTDAEVNELFEHVATKVIMVKNFDWWKATLDRLQNQASVNPCQASSNRT